MLLRAGEVVASGPTLALMARLDLPLAQGDAAASVVQAEVASHDAAACLTTVRFSGGVVACHLGQHHAGRSVALGQRQVEPRHQRQRWAAGHHLAGAQQHQVVRQARHFVGRVADVDHGNVQLALQPVEVGQQLGLARGIERGQWFVHQQQRGAGCQCARDGHALAFAARERGGTARQQRRQPQQLHRLLHRHAAACGWLAAQAVFDVAAHAQVVEQAGLLEHVAQRAPVWGQPLPTGFVLPDLAVHDHAALGGALQPGERTQAGRLAAARGAEQCRDAVAGQLQVHVEREAGALQAQAGEDVIHSGLLRGCSQCSAISTMKENATMPPASQCACAYSMASTWS